MCNLSKERPSRTRAARTRVTTGLLLAAAAAFVLVVLGFAASSRASPAESFGAFVERLWPKAREAGVSRKTFDAATKGLAPEPSLRQRARSQGEFTLPVQAYVAGAVTSGRASRARALARELAAPLARIERTSGVPSNVTLAVLGVESDFGASMGNADVLRVLATLAYQRPEETGPAEEFAAALLLLQNGNVARERLLGSWAGATGQPQFLPTAYFRYARSLREGEAPDIWTSREDAAASVANFLSASGWKAELPWGIEAAVPQGFDFTRFDLDFAEWRALGFVAADGAPLPSSGPASLYLPAGAKGPAFLITDNFEVIRRYNASDAYALAVGLLADRAAGKATPVTPWPKVEALSANDCRTMQQLLAERGFYAGPFDGKLGRKSRNGVHAFQLSEGLHPADGLATKAVLARLQAKAPAGLGAAQ